MVHVSARFEGTAPSVDKMPPPDVPEVALLGRSNVGKSSVINTLLGSDLARTSSTPGRTRGINLYQATFHPADGPGPDLRLVDLPGYGYASGPKSEVHGWRVILDDFVRERPTLALCLLVVDASLPPQDRDLQAVAYLGVTGRAHLGVANKADRLPSPRRAAAIQALSRGLGLELLPFSTRTGDGREELWRRIRRALAASSGTGTRPRRGST